MPNDPSAKDSPARPDRRGFIKAAGALGAAAGLRSAASYARIVGANERVNVGHVGVGNRGTSLLEMVVAGCPDARVTAVCDIYPPYLDNAKKAAGGDVKTFVDHRKLMEDKDIDAVVIASPDHWHAIHFVDACRAGKDVYVEKPLSLTVAEGRTMCRVAAETGRVTQMGAQRHSSPHVVEACKLMREGAIGKVTRARCFHLANEWPNGIGKFKDEAPPEGLDWDLWLGPAPKVPYRTIRWNYKFRWFWDYSGGQMTNFGTHYIDVVQMALGQDAPRRVTALGGRFAVDDDREVPDTMEAVWEYDGCLATFSQINANDAEGCRGGAEIEFRGTTGTLYLHGNRYEIVPQSYQDSEYPMRGPLDKSQIKRKKSVEARTVPGRIDQEGHMRDFFACVKTRGKCALDVETGHRSTTATLIANIAYRTKSQLEWDRAAERFTNSDEANKLLSYAYREPWKL